MSTLSYQEKTLLGTLVAELLVFIPYFIDVMHRPITFTRLAATIILLIVAQIIIQSIIAVTTRHRVKDERDRQIGELGYRNAYFGLGILVVTGRHLLCLDASSGSLSRLQISLHFLSVFLGMFVLAEMVKISTQLVAYRRSI